MTPRRVAVIGLGVTGRAVAGRLNAAGYQVMLLEDHPSRDTAEAAAALGLSVTPMPSGPGVGRLIDGIDLVVPSPGVPVGHPILDAARRAGIPIWAEIELAGRLGAGQGHPLLIAITGTNGKTTVTTLVTAILNRSGRKAVAAGNIGVPLIEAVGSGADVVVAEVSSFQLEMTDAFHPRISCWLNLAADHLDWHPSPEHYAAAKAKIWANQGEGDTAVYNTDDPAVRQAAGGIPPGVERVDFSTRTAAAFSVQGGRLSGPQGTDLMAVAELPRALPHDVANSLAAAAVAMAAGATAEACRLALASTAPLPHRVGLIAESGGITWYDDSKATTPASVLAAVEGFSSVVLIAGGRNKGLDLEALSAAVPPVRAVVAIGEAAAEVAHAFTGLVPVTTAGTMAAAVEEARAAARPGDAVLLSPGCASFDWYPSYAARGDHFAAIVRSVLEKGERPC
jgi:UDP-N-acetylmuramoylalanine--D-glutamate ligase